jgi:DNA-binding response OmpR family regulator
VHRLEAILDDDSSSAGRQVGVALLSAESSAPDDVLASAIRAMSLDAIQVSSLLKLRRLLISARVDLVIIVASGDAEAGLQLCEQVRATSDIPLIVILPGDKEDMFETAFDIGVDDCFSAFLAMSQCQARIRALLRRAAYALSHRVDPTVIRFGKFVLHPRERVLRDLAGTTIDLTSTEFDLMLTFCRNPGRVMTREELLSLTHTGLAGPVTRTIDVHVSRLRQKLEPHSDSPTLLKTVRLGGYILVVDVISD